MTESYSRATRHTLRGTFWSFLGEGLALPTGFVVVVFLTRRLGPAGYGFYTLSAVLIAWLEASIASLFARTTIKLISEAENWKPIGANLTRMHFLTGCALAGLLLCLANPIAALMGEPLIADYVRLFALDLPIFSLVLAHKYILIGIGGFRQRALASTGRYTTRLVLMVLLVELGLSVPGAILGNIGASVIELAIYRYYIRPGLIGGFRFPVRRFMEYSIPLFTYGMSVQIFERLDLFALTMLGGSATAAGIYGAAQNVSIIPPGILVLSFSPILLSTINRLLFDQDVRSAKDMGAQAMRAVIALLPFAAGAAGAASEITLFAYGPAYSSAAPVLAILVFGALAMVFVSVASNILTAGGKPVWAFALVGPLVPLAVIGHLLMIPRFGAIGAATVTTTCAIAAALASVFAIHRLWRLLPSAATLLRSLAVSAIIYAISAFWVTQSVLLLLKLSIMAVVIMLLYWLLGETNPRQMWSLIAALLPKGMATSVKENRW
jgi:O-antigen/teichoic acid export membrane protein